MPKRSVIHIDRALTNISVAYAQNSELFIADKVFPVVPTDKKTDVYFRYTKETFLSAGAELRRPRTESAGGDYDVEIADPFNCKTYAYHKDVTPEDRDNADSPLQADTDATQFVTSNMLLTREKMFIEKYFKTGVWGTEVTGVAGVPGASEVKKWSEADSNPIKDVKTARRAMQGATAFMPNGMLLGPKVYDELTEHQDFLDRVVYTMKGAHVTKELISGLFELDKILVIEAVINSAGARETAAIDFIAGDHALLFYAEPAPALKKPSAGYIFAWKKAPGAGRFGNTMDRIPMPWLGKGTERIEGEMNYDMQVIAADMGYFFKDII